MPTPTQTKPQTAAAVPTSSDQPTLIAPEPTIELAVALPPNCGPTVAAVAALDAALIKARGSFAKVVKDSENPHFRSKYAGLSNVLEAVMPALAAEGLNISSCTVLDHGACKLTTTLSHVGGGWRISEFPIADLSPQKLGSAQSYGMRYGTSALLHIAAEDEDDDGEAATARKAWAPKTAAPAAPAAASRPLF